MTTGLASDYTESIKQHKIEGQNLTMWEQFLTGTQNKFKTLGEQVTSAYETGVAETQQTSAYDISQAYSNYKKQQLSLQMQDQLGTGFKQELGSELKSAYDTTYSGLEKQRESALSKLQSEYVSSLTELGEEYDTAVKKGESEFAKLGEQAQAFDRLMHDFAENYTWTEKDEQGNDVSKSLPAFEKGVHYTTKELEGGGTETILTDEGRLWYSDIFNNENFQKWFLEGGKEDDLTSAELKQREEIYEAYRKNPYLFKQVISGIDSKFDAEQVKKDVAKKKNDEQIALKEEVYNTMENLDDATKTIIDTHYGKNFSKFNVTAEQAKQISENVNRNKEYVSTMTASVVGASGKGFTDDYGNRWETNSGNYSYTPGQTWGDRAAKNLAKDLGLLNNKGWISTEHNYKQGDIIYHNNKYYMITTLTNKTFAYREVSPHNAKARTGKSRRSTK